MSQTNPALTADISLILCTYGRVNEVNNFLKSIYAQTIKPAEIIIVDQNEKEILKELINEWQPKLAIKHKRVNFKGASKSRNYGAREAKFSLIAFPDDDCLYPSKLVEEIAKLFQCHPKIDVVLASKIEPSEIHDVPTELTLCHSRVSSILDLFKAKAETSNIFTRRSILKSLSYVFDENIGPGANTPWASNEETDFLIRLLKKGAKIIKLNDLAIAHHSLQGSPTKSLKYGMGRFEVILKNHLGIRIYLINLLQPIARYFKSPTPYNLLLCLSTMLGRSGIINLTHRFINHSL